METDESCTLKDHMSEEEQTKTHSVSACDFEEFTEWYNSLSVE